MVRLRKKRDAGEGGTIKESRDDWVFLAVVGVILVIVLIAVLFPLVYIVSSSFSSSKAVITGQVWLWPVEPTLAGYEAVLSHPGVMRGFANSIFYTVAGTMVNVVMTVLIAYPLSRRDFVGRGVLTFLLVFTMLFYGGLIPTYLVVKTLGMVNTRWAMIIPEALIVWFVIIARTFFQSNIPQELAEVSEIDGCSDARFMWSVVLPLAKPVIAVLVLMYAIFHWNAYFQALIYLGDERMYPLQIVLRNILILNQTLRNSMRVSEQMLRQGLADLLKFSLIVVASAPMLILYPFIQRHFIKGILIGSLKG